MIGLPTVRPGAPPVSLREFYSAKAAAARRWAAMQQAAGAPRLHAFFVKAPPSALIAERLATAGATVCPHGRRPCILRCGVTMDRSGWRIIPKAERNDWLLRRQQERLD